MVCLNCHKTTLRWYLILGEADIARACSMLLSQCAKDVKTFEIALLSVSIRVHSLEYSIKESCKFNFQFFWRLVVVEGPKSILLKNVVVRANSSIFGVPSSITALCCASGGCIWYCRKECTSCDFWMVREQLKTQESHLLWAICFSRLRLHWPAWDASSDPLDGCQFLLLSKSQSSSKVFEPGELYRFFCALLMVARFLKWYYSDSKRAIFQDQFPTMRWKERKENLLFPVLEGVIF